MEDGDLRLITRSNFDGLVCAILLRELNLIDRIAFAHPRDVQHDRIEIGNRDVLANVAYHPDAHLVFDHHVSEAMRVRQKPANCILDPSAPSSARVIYNYFGGKRRFPHVPFHDLLAAVDKNSSAQFSKDDVLNPRDWDLLAVLLDARTGLGRFGNFTVSNHALMMELMDDCRQHPIQDVLKQPGVKERSDLYGDHQQKSVEQIRRSTAVHGNVGILDLRHEDIIYVCNRFLIYAMFPEINVSVHVLWGAERLKTVFAVGKSIFNRTSQTNIGALTLNYGGGGSANAGSCEADHEDADRVLGQLIATINREG